MNFDNPEHGIVNLKCANIDRPKAGNITPTPKVLDRLEGTVTTT